MVESISSSNSYINKIISDYIKETPAFESAMKSAEQKAAAPVSIKDELLSSVKEINISPYAKKRLDVHFGANEGKKEEYLKSLYYENSYQISRDGNGKAQSVSMTGISQKNLEDKINATIERDHNFDGKISLGDFVELIVDTKVKKSVLGSPLPPAEGIEKKAVPMQSTEEKVAYKPGPLPPVTTYAHQAYMTGQSYTHNTQPQYSGKEMPPMPPKS